jgi:hypothetical protein
VDGGTVATFGTVVVGAVAAGVAWRAARAAERAASATRDSVDAQVLLEIAKLLQATQMRKNRRTVLQAHRRSDWLEDKTVVEAAEEVAQAFNTTGVLVHISLVDEGVVLENWGAQVVQCWKAIRPLTLSRREREKNKGLWGRFEWLYNRALATGVDVAIDDHSSTS